MNAPWINKIFIVTNGQIPEWLDVSHPKIRLVTHKEIMPADALPTFNSEAIESCITNIPGLSEHFLYACDDMFINGPVTPDFFFDQDGDPIIRMVEHNWTEEQIEKSLFLKNVTHSMYVIKEKYDKEYKFEAIHNIDAYRKSYIQACQKEFREEYDKVCRCKFRKEYSIERTSYAYWALANNLGKFVCCKNKVSEDTTPLDTVKQSFLHLIIITANTFLSRFSH